jgi:hypothetical protein
LRTTDIGDGARALAHNRVDAVSVECIQSKVPASLLGLLDGKDVCSG